MYATVSNQFIHMLHYGLAFVVLMVLWPRLLFAKLPGGRLEQTAGNFMKMALLLIVLGYALVATKLYELISIAAILAVLSARKYLSHRAAEVRGAMREQAATLFYDYLDKKFTIRGMLLQWGKRHLQTARAAAMHRLASFRLVTETALFVAIFAVSAYIRFTDAVRHAAPGMSDGYVTLAWMKYIDARELFHDGIYPQGFHIILNLLFKFSGIDALYVLKYTGPLNTMLLILGFYVVVSRFTRSAVAGMVAAMLYGFLSPLFTGASYERQAATNSQEFAFVFVLPALYFFYLYLRTRTKEVFWAAAAGTAVVGLVHSLAFAVLGLGLGVELLIALLLAWRANWRPALRISIAGAGAAVLSLIPWLLGILLGKKFHASSEQYLTGKAADITPPTLQLLDYITLAAIAVVFVHALLRKGARMDRFPQLFTVVFGASVFMIYYGGGALTHSVLIATRSGDLWALCIPLVIGMGWFAIFQCFAEPALKRRLELAAGCGVLAASLILIPPQPNIPYKMESDIVVEQYLRISQLYRPKTWMIVSLRNEEYDLAFGSGYHMFAAPPDPQVPGKNLLQMYDPTQPPLTKYGETHYDANIPNDIFIMVEKRLYQVSARNAIYPLMKPKYELWMQQTADLQRWIRRYEDTHEPGDGKQSCDIFYEDAELAVYHLHRIQTRDEVKKMIWG